eukprot:TRINITY_DN12669_c0_g1_i3.p1 TRINITY_DN12669_c0_g1~~TRINITY_DN12669_c0_g1_i3.p1  ORF type:complete len:143 (-),score=8.35 TRINITY_DN12669_c0_g1_i3:330-758(-)
MSPRAPIHGGRFRPYNPPARFSSTAVTARGQMHGCPSAASSRRYGAGLDRVRVDFPKAIITREPRKESAAPPKMQSDHDPRHVSSHGIIAKECPAKMAAYDSSLTKTKPYWCEGTRNLAEELNTVRSLPPWEKESKDFLPQQ